MFGYSDKTFNEKIIDIAIIVVTIMIVVCLVILLFVLGGHGSVSSSTHNVIGTQTDDIKLTDDGDIEELSFSVDNMFPGDSVTKKYHVVVTMENINIVKFKAEIVSDNAALSDYLKIQVKAEGMEDPIYDGLIADMPRNVNATVTTNVETEYEITVTLDSSAGNDCQNGEIAVKFSWWIDALGFVEGHGYACDSELALLQAKQ